MDRPLQPFYFHHSLRKRYVSGSCEDLADALQTSLGGEKWEIQTKLGDRTIGRIHYVSKFGQFYVDIEGIWTSKPLLRRWMRTELEDSSVRRSFRFELVKSKNEIEDEDVESKLLANIISIEILKFLNKHYGIKPRL